MNIVTNKTSFLLKIPSIIVIFFGIYIFLHGFLLNRSEIHNEANEKLQLSVRYPSSVVKHNRIILLLVDAFSYEFIQQNNTENHLRKYFSRDFQNPYLPLRDTLSKASFVGKFVADPPTTTLQRLKALMTGSMPTFIDAGMNFGGDKVMEDNLLKRWNNAGKQILFVGDETWIDLFPDYFTHYKSYPSFNVKDLDTVDRGVENYILHVLNNTTSGWNNRTVDHNLPQMHWDILIGHMLGIDHCGHTYGPAHPEMMRKLDELNNFIQLIISKLQPTDILFILGDHGMTRSGDHGGDSNAELEAALIVFNPNQSSLNIEINSDKQTTKRLAQIDLVPTLSLLTNVPIPYSNLGVLYDGLLGHCDNFHQGLVLNFIQMFTYTANYFYNVSRLPLSSYLLSNMNRVIENSIYDWVDQMNNDQLISILNELQTVFRIHWTQFNELRIFLGVILTIVSLYSLFLSIETMPNIKHIHIRNALLCSTGIFSFFYMHRNDSMYLLCLIISMLITLLFLIQKNAAQWIFAHFSNNLISFVFLLLLSLSYLSNSLLIYEFHITFYFIQTILLIFVINSMLMLLSINITTYSNNHYSNSLKFFHSSRSSSVFFLCLLLLFRLVIYHFLICREELNFTSLCRSNLNLWIGKHLSKLNPINEFYPIGVMRLIGAILMLFTCLYVYWRLLYNCCVDSHQSNRIDWKKLSLVILIGSLFSFLWMIDSTESLNWIGFIQKHKLHTIRIWIARFLLMIICYIFHRLTQSPCYLLQQMNLMSSNDFGNILYLYTLWTTTCLIVLPLLFLLVFLNEFNIVWLLVIIILVQLFTPMTTTNSNQLNKCNENLLLLQVPKNCISWMLAVFLCLLDNISFFITGHQPTLSGIPWDAAYAAYEGDHNTRWLPGLTVLLHLYSGPILVAFSLPTILILSLRFHHHNHKMMIHSIYVNKSSNTPIYRFIDALDLLMWRFIISKSVLVSCQSVLLIIFHFV
ncbi:GPI ethanolamine phosphate transferase 3 [Schistosoma japonicum]|nr:GPI ethanolamine phosphate transferase 3 [Schistosoma japonicum]